MPLLRFVSDSAAMSFVLEVHGQTPDTAQFIFLSASNADAPASTLYTYYLSPVSHELLRNCQLVRSMTFILVLVLASVFLATTLNCSASPNPAPVSPECLTGNDDLITFNAGSHYSLDPDFGDSRDQQAVFHASAPACKGTPTFALKARPTTVWRPRSRDAIQHARLRSLRHAESEPVEWEQVDTSGPDIEDQYTLSQLARMTGNAYALPMGKSWYNLDPTWNTVSPNAPNYSTSVQRTETAF